MPLRVRTEVSETRSLPVPISYSLSVPEELTDEDDHSSGAGTFDAYAAGYNRTDNEPILTRRDLRRWPLRVVSDIELLYLGLQHGLVERVRQWLKPAIRPQRTSRALDARKGNLPISGATLPCSGSVKGAILDPDRAADMWEGKGMAPARRVLAASLAALIVLATQPSKAAEPGVVEVAVFDFVLDDRSAGRGIIDQDPIDTENLKTSTQEARRMLSASGLFSVVDASR
jgi:hypothetical protein